LKLSASVLHRGRKLTDFRPGLPLEDFRADYTFAGQDSSMSVVGHVEQMHKSRCYQGSDTLSCLTCHDPHHEPRPDQRTAYYQSICKTCHQPERCKVSPERRQRESPANDCVHCHMPTGPTEIPHIAFTHHRIGIHDQAEPASTARSQGNLTPFLDISHLGEADRQRSLGLGYLEIVNEERDEVMRRRYQEQARRALADASARGLRDSALDAGLTRLHMSGQADQVLRHAQSVLAQPDAGAQDRCDALFALASVHAEQRRYQDAIVALQELNRLRRHSVHWLLLADCRRGLGDQDAAVAALENAVRIDPRLWKIHQLLAEHYRRQGNQERAAWHDLRAIP
jgi:hypothetical protein